MFYITAYIDSFTGMARKPDRPRITFCAHHRQGISMPADLETRIDFKKTCFADRFCKVVPTKKELLSTKSSFFVYPSRRLGISSPREVRRISSAPVGLYLITRQRASYLRLDDIQTFGLMIYRNKLRMIYTPCGVIRFAPPCNPRDFLV